MKERPTRSGIANRGFIALMTTLSCGALNDNVYRGMLLFMVVGDGLWSGRLGQGGTGVITFMLYAPFIVLLGFTGMLADRYPKRRIIVLSRVAELILALGVVGAMSVENLPLACVLLILLASQSAFFSPAKYGSVPEMVDSSMLSRANGVMSLLTNVSIVAGVAAAGHLLAMGKHVGMSGPMFVGIVMVGIASIGLVSSLFMVHKPAAKPDLKMSLNGFRTYWRTFKAMKGTDLTAATIAWCLFFAVGSLIINIIPHYTQKESLGLTDAQGSNLLGAATLGIAIGGAIVGIGSGHRIRPMFVPIGSVLMGICFFVLGLCDLGYIGVMIVLALTGAAAGIFVVPILALLQHLPVAGFRARCVGTANFMTYMSMSITAVIYWALTKWISALPPTWFLISGCFMVFVTAWLLLLMPKLRHGSLKESFSTVEDFE